MDFVEIRNMKENKKKPMVKTICDKKKIDSFRKRRIMILLLINTKMEK